MPESRHVRRGWACALLAVLLAAGPAGAAVRVAVGAPLPVRIPGSFVGLSLEYSSAAEYAGGSPATMNPVYEALVRGLAPGSPPIVRIGGRSGDHTWVPAPGLRPRPGVTLPLDATYIATIARFVRDIGGRLMLGIDLEAGDPLLAEVEARQLVAGIGRQWIRSLELGNEPSLYRKFAYFRDAHHQRVYARPPGWSVPRYLREYEATRRRLPALPLSGPDLGDATWMGQLDRILTAEPRISEVTYHRYAGNACFAHPGSRYFASVANLLSPVSSRGLAATVLPYVAIARRHHATLRIDEFNTEACSGKSGVSDTFASALWELDALFAMAAVGVDGVNVQTFPRAPYRLFTFRHSHAGAWLGTVNPDYYGLLLFSQAAPAGSRLLRVSAPAGDEPWLRAWATRGRDGALRILLLNDSPSAAHTVEVRLPASFAGHGAFAERLLGPSVRARSGVTLGGQSFPTWTATGRLEGTPSVTAMTPRGTTLTVALPTGSATLIDVPQTRSAGLHSAPPTGP